MPLHSFKYAYIPLVSILLFLHLPLQGVAQIESDIEYEDFVKSPTDPNAMFVAPQGIYTHFNQLKSKTPANNDSYTVRQRREFWGYSYLVFLENTKKRENKAFAYSDGANLFVNARNFGEGNYYLKIDHYGRFNFFRALMMRRGLGVGIGVGPVVVGNNGGQVYGMVLDMNNGEIIRLTPKKMKLLLSKYPELLRRYENEKHRNHLDVMEAYIIELNYLNP